jgi:hypothetical protein
MAFQNAPGYTLECWVLTAEKKFQGLISKWNRQRGTTYLGLIIAMMACLTCNDDMGYRYW